MICPFWPLCTNGGPLMWFHICPDTIAKQKNKEPIPHIVLLYRKSKLLRLKYKKPATRAKSTTKAKVPE
jgi:hypothetical protein